MSEQLVTFPHGLVGCETWKHFMLVESPEEHVHQLLCLDEPNVGFLTAEAETIAPRYQLELTDADQQLLGCGERGDTDVQVLCTLTLHQEPPRVTANLVGPLVINRATGIGKQVVLVNSSYSIRHPVLDMLPERSHARAH